MFALLLALLFMWAVWAWLWIFSLLVVLGFAILFGFSWVGLGAIVFVWLVVGVLTYCFAVWVGVYVSCDGVCWF